MLTKEEVAVIAVIMDAAVIGLKDVEANPSYSAIQAGAAAGVGVSRLPSNYKITSEVILALRDRLTDEDSFVDPDDATQVADPEAVADALFESIKHGSETHQVWLKSALRAFYNGEDIPEPDAPAVASTPEQMLVLLGLDAGDPAGLKALAVVALEQAAIPFIIGEEGEALAITADEPATAGGTKSDKKGGK